MEVTIHDYGSAPGGTFYRLSTGRAAHYENIIKPHSEVNGKGTMEKNDGNQVIEEETGTPLNLDPNDVIEADDETLTLRRRGLARP